MIKMRAIPESRLWHRCCHPDVDRQEIPSTGRLGPVLPWKCHTRQVPEGFPNTPRLLSHPAQHLLCFPVGLYFGAWSHAPCYVCEVLGQGSAAGALDIEDIQLHAFVNLVFEPWAGVCHCPLLTTAGSEHARNRRHLCRGIICSPYGESSVQVGLSVPG